MGLIKLIKNLDSATKTALLGDRITRILRYTFVQSDHAVLDDNILNEALALQLGDQLVKSKRKLLLEAIRLRDLKAMGVNSHDEAIDLYARNLNRFITDFQIEEDYIPISTVDNRQSLIRKVPKYGECNGISAYPHDYQYRLKKEILLKLTNELNPIILASMPTGAGKTVLAMEIIIDLFRAISVLKNKKVKILWVVESKELSEQSLQSFLKLWSQKGDSTVDAERYFGKFNTLSENSGQKITFATFDLLTSRLETDEVSSLLREVDFLFIDEAHSSDAFTYHQVIQKYKNVNQEHKILGLTATPYRSDDGEFKKLKDLFKDFLVLLDKEGIPLKSPLSYLIEGKYLSKVSFEILDIQEANSQSEYYRSMHNSILNECNKLINEGKNSIIFAQSKAHAVALSIFLKREGIKNGLIVGETNDVKRESLLKEFGNQESDLSILVNHQILSTGIDVPGMNSIMILAEIQSPTLALQILGRAMRGPKNGGNMNNVIYLTPINEKKLRHYRVLESIVLN